MFKAIFFRAFFGMAAASLSPNSSYSQMKLDTPADSVRRLANETYIEDLTVNDTAHVYNNICIENGGMYLPGWTQPADLANSSYAQTGVILKIQVLPGKKLKTTLVDAAQAQAVAKGKSNEPASLDPAAYRKAVIDYVNGLYKGTFFGPRLCEEERRGNPVRTLTLYPVESINGYSKISDLIASFSK